MRDISRYESEIQSVVNRLVQCNEVLVITGAGMSADSGLPTYRGIGGLYQDTNTEDGIPIEQALSGPVFRRTPEITWKYLGQIEKGTRGARHNRGHEVLAEMESYFRRFWILTQNVDGFHTSAGSKNVIEIHGNLHQLNCLGCGHASCVDAYAEIEIPPHCPECGSMMRPAVVLFEEQLPLQATHTLNRQRLKPFDAVISIGTSSYFPYIIQPVLDEAGGGALTVEINPANTPISPVVDVRLPLGAAAALNEIWSRLSKKIA